MLQSHSYHEQPIDTLSAFMDDKKRCKSNVRFFFNALLTFFSDVLF